MQQPSTDFSLGAAYVCGEYVPISQACVPITDWGFLRSDATYDVATVWEGAFFRLDAHLERFFASCRSFRLDPAKLGKRSRLCSSAASACPRCAIPMSR